MTWHIAAVVAAILMAGCLPSGPGERAWRRFSSMDGALEETGWIGSWAARKIPCAAIPPMAALGAGFWSGSWEVSALAGTAFLLLAVLAAKALFPKNPADGILSPSGDAVAKAHMACLIESEGSVKEGGGPSL